ncbi:PIN domain-containing protein [Lacimicrobium alkaliphilum]|uniref:PIN domain-containing protein n=1 Tax=Lacimicrobium alkaliphilum TaxID=1526571 RepID=A0A0U2PEW0_9ALTE|nr:hypothetical protein [Lacimicrobium alkaliphilum]ALS97789.1 hypothetical protein AT746_05540 [Lacimicrobium alkaliphilum]
MIKDNGPPTGRIIQNHSGLGDNVREKHVHQAITPSVIQKPIVDILTSLRHRNIDTAKEKLTTLQTTDQLDASTTAILSAASVLVELAYGQPPENSYSQIENCIRAFPDGLFNDIALSILMRLDLHNERSKDAISRYEVTSPQGEYCQEVYFEFIATKNYLESHFTSKATALTEITLCGLTRGLLRCESLEQSVAAAERLKTIYPSFNSKVVSLITRCNHFNSLISPTHYWLITRSEKRLVMELVDEAIALLNECQGKDKRLIIQSIGFLNYFGGSEDRLIDACWKHISAIEQLDSKAASILRSIKERSSNTLTGPQAEIDKAERDFSYRKFLIKRLTENAEISREQFFILSHIAQSNDIAQWLNRGGKVDTTNDIERHFVTIELLCLKDDGSPKSKLEIKNAVAKLVSAHTSELSQLNPHRMLDLTTKLTDADLASQVCTLLNPVVPKGDLWLSPLVRIYIIALFNSHQLITLKAILDDIPAEDWCGFLWEVKARQLERINDISGAIEAMESALKLDADPLPLWHYLIHLHKRNQTPKAKYAALLKNIPNELFIRPSKLALPLLIEISCNDGFFRAENILVNWFVENPNDCAKDITNFHFSKAALKKEDLHLEPSKTTDVCLGGFNFLLEGKAVSKLIVQNIEPSHSSLLKSDSPLGEILLNMQVGESANHGMQEVKLVEVLPPYVAILRMACDLRQTNNDGSDCFYQLSLPEDPEEMISSVERKLLLSTDGTEEAICSNPAIPLFLKGHRFEKQCPVHAALNQYCSTSSIKHPLPNFGESQPSQIILDVYAIVYLGLTGLIHGLIQSTTTLAITMETKALLEAFLENINREDYMRMGIEKDTRKIRITTSAHVKAYTADVQNAIKHALETAEIITPRLVDMPPDIVQIHASVDESVYSSLSLSISNDIPWLCIDPTFAQLSKQASYPIANSLQFCMSISVNLDIEQKLVGLYRHVTCGIPYPLTYEELLQLARSKDEYSNYFLAKLLQMYPNAYQNTEEAIAHLHKILVITLAQTIFNGETSRKNWMTNPGNFEYTEHVFNSCCQLAIHQADGKEAEQKLALLLCAVMEHLRHIPKLNILIRQLATQFIEGHFMSFDAINTHIREITK